MKHWTILAACAAALVVLSKLVVEDLLGVRWGLGTAPLFTHAGPGSAAAIVGLLAVDLLLPLPSSLVMVLSGALFGTLAGGALSLAGSLIGNLAGFELTRRYGRGPARRLVGDAQLAQLQQIFARRGGLVIVLTRPLPIVMETLSLVAGLSGMKRSAFLIASVAGTVPPAFAYAYAGAAARDAGTFTPAIVLLVALFAAGWIAGRRMRG